MNRLNKITRLFCAVAIAVALISTLTMPVKVKAHSAGVVLFGSGTGIIDGVISPGEWDNAGKLNLSANLPPLEGGGTSPATVYVMNDSNNLYLAVKIARPSLDLSYVAFEFDNDHDGVRESGDDAFFVNGYPSSPGVFFDNVRLPFPDDPSGLPLNGPMDVAQGGTLDGQGAVTNDGTFTVYELSHPLDSSDDAHDFSLGPGDAVGFWLNISLIVGAYPQGYGDTYFPTDSPMVASEFADIIITPIPSAIDIKPDSTPNVINSKNKGTIPVAILSTQSFYAPTGIDPTTLTFGKTGDEQSLSHYSVGDVNADGIIDIIAHFHTQATGFQPGDTVGVLKGQMANGATFVGTDSVLIVQ